MFTNVVVHRHAAPRHLELHHLRDEWHTTATGGTGLVAGLHRADGADAFTHSGADGPLGDVVARADLCGVGQGVHAQARFGLAVAGREDQELGVFGQGDAVQRHLQQRAVFRSVANQHRAQQLFAVFADDDLFVDLAQLVHVLAAAALGRAAMGVTNAGHVHTHEFEFGAHVGTHKRSICLTRNVACRHTGHVVARSHQAKGLFVPRGTFANGVHIVVAGAAGAVDRHTTPRAHGQQALAGQFVAGADACGEHDHVGLQVGAVGKHHAVARPGTVGDLLRVAAGVHVQAQLFDLGPQHAAAAFVHLHGHQAGGEFDHVGFQPHVAQGLGAFQAQQAAAHYDAGFRLGTRGLHGLQVFDGAVDMDVFAVTSGHRWHKGVGAGGQHEFVVGEHFTVGGGDGISAAVHRRSARGQPQREAGAFEKAGLHQREGFCRGAAEKRRQVHTVVGRAWLLTQHGDFHVGEAGLGQAFQELVAHHAVANNNDFHTRVLQVPGVSADDRCEALHAGIHRRGAEATHPPRNHGCGLELPNTGGLLRRVCSGVPPSLAEGYSSPGQLYRRTAFG